MITLDKITGSENYQSWASSMDLWIIGNGCYDHLTTVDPSILEDKCIEVAQSNSKVVISQRKYTVDILADTDMLDCKLVYTPKYPNVKFVPGQGDPLQDPGRYQRLVRKLNYLTITRPNISFPVSVIS